MNDKNMRLQKFIANAGVTSRRKAEELIADGKVRVNNVVTTKLGTLVGHNDIVEVNGAVIKDNNEKIYILLNKPEGYVTTLKDHFGRKIVTDLLGGIKERVYPIGRLDYNTSGLILLTNDGEFANMIMHPSSEIEKEYFVKIDKPLSDDDFSRLVKGIRVEDYIALPKEVRVLTENSRNSYVSITISEGKNREVRKIFETLGYRVSKLKRVRIASLEIGALKKGHFRYLSAAEVIELKNLSSGV
jgi:23S rRNA pseudouridine2605 synthase